MFTEGTSAASQGLAYVFGDTDTHLTEAWQTTRSSWRWGRAAGDFFFIPVRNFNVGTFRRNVEVYPGDFFESRYFLVLGDVEHIESTVVERELVDAATYGKVSIGQDDSPILSYRVQTDVNGASTVLESGISSSTFATFAQPVEGSKPLFLIQDAEGNSFLTVDPYAISSTPYDGTTEYVGFLGFVIPEE